MSVPIPAVCATQLNTVEASASRKQTEKELTLAVTPDEAENFKKLLQTEESKANGNPAKHD